MEHETARIARQIKGHKYHRVLYVLMIVYISICLMRGEENANKGYIVLTAAIVGMFVAELVLDWFKYFGKIKVLCVFRYAQYLVFSCFVLQCRMQRYAMIAIVAFFVLFAYEYIMADDIIDFYDIILKIVILAIPIVNYIIWQIVTRQEDTAWMYALVTYCILLSSITKIMVDIVEEKEVYEKEMNKYRVLIHDMEHNNDKLLDFQKKIRKVNEELNLQRIQLEKANEDVNQANNEMMVQAEMLKCISSTFEVQDAMTLVANSINDVKKTLACGIYIEKGVFLNKKTEIVVSSKIDSMSTGIREHIPQIYQDYCQNQQTEWVVDDNIEPGKYPFADARIVKSILFCPFWNDREGIFGIAVVASNQKESFYGTLPFYEATVQQFMVALNNSKLYHHMENMARTDGLTGINNRKYFNSLFVECTEKAKAEGKKVSVALFDIDKFKRINDTYGHLVGDEVIKTIAHLTEEHIEQYEGFVCRYGGEEFVAVLPAMGIEEALPVIQGLHQKIATTIVRYGGYEVSMNVSIGITCYPETCTNIQDLLKRADWSMYYSKEHGRGCITIDSEKVNQAKL